MMKELINNGKMKDIAVVSDMITTLIMKAQAKQMRCDRMLDRVYPHAIALSSISSKKGYNDIATMVRKLADMCIDDTLCDADVYIGMVAEHNNKINDAILREYLDITMTSIDCITA